MSRLTVSGSMVELMVYPERSCPMDPVQRSQKKRSEKSNQKRMDNIARAKRQLKRLIYCNPDMQNHVVLTYRKNISDRKITKKDFSIFMRKLKKITRRKELKYLSVIEYQVRGAIHFHVLTNETRISKKNIEKIWYHGFVKKRNIKKDLDLRHHYFSKELDKQFNSGIVGEKLYFCSKNLTTPSVADTQSKNIRRIISFYFENGYKKVFDNEYINSYVGTFRLIILKAHKTN